jgi:uncharacterized protein
MPDKNVLQVSQELAIKPVQAEAVASLLAEGATVPFIARYRKEATGSLDEVAILAVRDRLSQLKDLDDRRGAILKSLGERELLTPELEAAVNAAPTLAVLEDIYLPHRPKRRTRAMAAREKGLEPLALAILAQEPGCDPEALASSYVDTEKGVEDVARALAGARDIIAETANEDARARAALRELFTAKAVFTSKVISGQEEAGAKFRDYFDSSEPALSAPGHRVLAMRRGEKEGHLLLHVLPPQEDALAVLTRLFVRGEGPAAQQVRLAMADAYKRLLAPALETELRLATKDKAEAEAVKVFAENLRQLLLAPPLGQKRVLAIDPGYRTGCKVACMDAQGRLLAHDVIHLLSERQQAEATQKLRELCARHAIEAIAVGNGTAGREAEALARGLGLTPPVPVVMVSEAGASVYSASEVARLEFPDLDLTVRGAVSIGRRLMDPLAELVKIEPKAIGVGQYQHDVDQGDLGQSLEDVVVSCVNAVGVEVNTASSQLLSYVSGLGPSLAKNIVAWREENGPFRDRHQLTKVPRLGPKAFEQAAGFLRIQGGANPLDASAVHPESYPLVEAMARDLGCLIADLLRDQGLRGRIDASRYVSESAGLPTITDILAELARPGRDPRQGFEEFSFAAGVSKLEDLEPGMRLPGIVTNVTNFGAFVDVGVHGDGLVHISQLADRFVSDPHQVVKVQQKVMVTVLEVDLARGRVSLSMRHQTPGERRERQERQDRQDRQDSRTAGGKTRRERPPAPAPAPKGPFNDALARALGKKLN